MTLKRVKFLRDFDISNLLQLPLENGERLMRNTLKTGNVWFVFDVVRKSPLEGKLSFQVVESS